MDAALNALLDEWVNTTEVREPNRRQRTLTARFLEPHLSAVAALFADLRAQTDRDVAAGLRDWPGPKPYPEGYCREIRNDVWARLKRLLAGRDNAAGGPIAGFLRGFLRAGGLAKPIWGDLRGAYLQNAIQLGALYVDVANDTVDVTKPKIEILPLAGSGMRAIRTPEHFAELAARYWKAPVYTNTLIPAVSPIFPLLILVDGELRFGPTQRPLMAHAVRDGFRPAERYLDGRLDDPHLLPAPVAEQVAESIRGDGLDPAVGAVRTGRPDPADFTAAFAAFRSSSGPFRDIAAFNRFAALFRPFERVMLASGRPGLVPSESAEVR
ncbi:hypothetical protein [Thalassobaculum sp.]|uniref:hypothetical protein n=1 Tax=Thalassobaculum sp. TaxID=2022740 RepID=UPI0032ED4D77